MDISLETLLAGDTMDLVRARSDDHDMSQPVMATGAVVVVEVLHEDGDKYLHTFRPDDTPSWVAFGMAGYAQQCWAADNVGG